jgi:hypothetical protein
MAAKEGMVIYMRGPPVYCSLPTDLPERILDYVLHVLAALSLLFESPCTYEYHITFHIAVFLIIMLYALPTGLPEWMLDYVLHVLAALSRLFERPCMDYLFFNCCYSCSYTQI